MGKKGGGAGGGKKGGGSSSQAKSTPKCVCDHPFQCSCGNRPERPSKGHRWDPETQKWGGKGHKQKGASGQTASVGVEAKTTTVGKTLIAQWQKLPSDILREWCQKQKRPQPKFKELLDDTAKAEFKTRVILNDPKNPDKDLFFTPKESVNNEEQALEEAALLALLNLTPTLPHERKLPEPYRTTWLNAIHAINESKNKSSNNKMRAKTVTKIEQTNKGITQPSVGNGSSGKSAGGGGAATSSSTLALATSFTSAAERRRNAEMNRQERNARIRKHEAVRMANRDHPVFLSARLRSQIQSFLRGDHESLSVNSRDPTEDDGDDDDATLDIFESDLQCYVEERLNHEGFTKRQARKAFSTKKVLNWANLDENEWEHVYEECLQWLCVHLDEDELPEGFDPRGSTLEVVAPSKMRADIAESKEKNGPESYVYNNVFPATAVVAAKYGITVKDALWMQHCQKDDPSKTLETIFWDRICQLAHATLNDAVVDNIASCNISLVEEEFEAIKAIFPDESTTTTNKESGTSTVCIKTLEGIEVVFSLSNIYPLIFPTNVLFTGNWPLPMGVAFHVEIVKFISTLPLGEPMMFEIFSHGQTLLQTMDELPKISLSSNDSIIKKNGDTLAGTISFKNFDTSDKEADVPKPQTDIQPIKRRPRSRGVFWSQSPDKTKPAVAFSWSRSIEIQRKSLPAWKARDDFLSILKAASKSSRVVLVTGDTGCGKTTQIPQFILEENLTSAKIVVAQPRRLAATGVAGRVAEERGEIRPGVASVGYVVRGDTAVCNDTRLLFCTFGILLRQLQSDRALDSISHIVIDEVHERNLDGDILMGLLRESLKANPHLNVILMSATLDADRFAAYWGDSPRIHIPGRTFPVQDYMLEDVLQRTRYNPPKKKRKQSRFHQSIDKPSSRKSTPWDDSEISDREEDDEEEEAIEGDEDTVPEQVTANDLVGGVSLEERVKRVDQESVDYNLLGKLVKHVVESKDMGDGSILIFLQGVGEIMQAKTIIAKITQGVSPPLLLLPLHGSLQPKDQLAVFRKVSGQVKVILSTNVAETSITIPDCTVVIDSCREKQSSYDPVNRMPLLLDQFTSKASLKQRRGRAGRVREGKCFKLISKATYDKLNEHTAPEISRCALDQTLLSLLFLGAEDGSGRFLQKLLDPPSVTSIKSAASSLHKLGALQPVEGNRMKLTPLGMHLAGIPAPPSIGKLLIMGCILGCRDLGIAMAAALSVGRSPLLRVDVPRRDDDSADRSRKILTERAKVMEQCGNSDHSMLATLFNTWQSLPTGGGKRKQYCENLGLSCNGMKEIAQLASQYDASLSSSGFSKDSESDRNVQSWRVLRTCAVAAMAPDQLVKVVRPSSKYEGTAEGARLKDGEAKEHKFFIRVAHEDNTADVKDETLVKEERVFIHPSSELFSVGTYNCPWLVFHSMIRTSKPFLRDATECSAFSLLLFGGTLRVETRNNIIVVDEWVKLSANARIGALVKGLRSKMDDFLSLKVDDPSTPIDQRLMELIVRLLITDGLG